MVKWWCGNPIRPSSAHPMGQTSNSITMWLLSSWFSFQHQAGKSLLVERYIPVLTTRMNQDMCINSFPNVPVNSPKIKLVHQPPFNKKSKKNQPSSKRGPELPPSKQIPRNPITFFPTTISSTLQGIAKQGLGNGARVASSPPPYIHRESPENLHIQNGKNETNEREKKTAGIAQLGER